MKYLKKYELLSKDEKIKEWEKMQNNVDLVKKLLNHEKFHYHIKDLILKDLNTQIKDRLVIVVAGISPGIDGCDIQVSFQTNPSIGAFYGRPINMNDVKSILKNIDNVSDDVFHSQPSFFMSEEDLIFVYKFRFDEFIKNNKWITEGENLGLM